MIVVKIYLFRNFNLADETESLMEREPDEYLEYDIASEGTEVFGSPRSPYRDKVP
jgi:hypothetical protein